jgi:hypothetical protein
MADHLAMRGRSTSSCRRSCSHRRPPASSSKRSRARDDDVYGEWAALVPSLTTSSHTSNAAGSTGRRPTAIAARSAGWGWRRGDGSRRRRRSGRSGPRSPRASSAASSGRAVARPETPRLVRLRPRTVR